MRQHLRVFACLVAGLLAQNSWAQFDAADVLGTIRDASSSPVAKVTVTLTNIDTGIELRTATDESGSYSFSNVKIGRYNIAAEAAGFSRSVANDVAVSVNTRQRVDLTLRIGAISDSVEVTSAAALLDTDSSDRGQVIRPSQIIELPLNGRAYADLALLTPGVIRAPDNFPSSTTRDGSFIVNGLRSVFSNYLLDGVDNNAYGTSNQGFSNQVIQPSPDSVAEFRVMTNNYSAEYGHSAGATVSVVTRSGGNRFHGTAYDFLRNTDLNAAGYIFGQRPATFQKPTLQQNQFGATIGGPIVKNRIFFFGDYEGFRSIQRAVSFATIPTLADRAGILPVTVTNPVTGAVYQANTQIPASAITPFARKVLGDLPLPNGAGRANNLQKNLPVRNYSDKFDAKLDAQLNRTTSGFLRIGQRKVNLVNASFGEPDFLDLVTYVINQQAVAGFTWSRTPSSIVEARFSVSRTKAGVGPTSIGSASALDVYGITGLPTTPNITGGLYTQVVSGFTSLGRSSPSPQFQNPTDFNAKVNFTQIFGKQTLKLGYESIVLREQVLDINPIYGLDTYTGGFSRPAGGPADVVSYSLADFMFGLRDSYQLSSATIPNFRRHFDFAYVQDDIRVSSTLTVNVGLRWEYASPWFERDNLQANFDPSTRSIVYAKAGSVYDRALVNPRWTNFAPRVGFAWSWTPKTVVRGGYGISYAHTHRTGSGELLGIFGPYGIVSTASQPDPRAAGFRATQAGYPAGFASPANFNPVNANITYIPRDLVTPYVQSWFFSIQREIWKHTLLDVGYVGNHSVGLPLFADYNQANPQPTPTSNLPLQARRPIPGFGAITWYDPAGFSKYNGLQVRVERRYTNGLSLQNSFTWSKGIDNSPQSLDYANGDQASTQNVRNLASDKGASDYDRKFVNVTNLVYELPFGKGRALASHMPAAVDQVFGGWQITAINNEQTALPINLRSWQSVNVPAAFQTVGNLYSWRGGEAFRPNVLGPVLNTSGGDITNQYFNTANVVLQTDPSHPFGNSGRNSTRALGLQQLDLGLYKNFNLFRESVHLQFRSEFFNVFNHTNFLAPNVDRNSPAFGTIRSTFPSRQVQLALKLSF